MNPTEPQRRSLIDDDVPPTDWSYVNTVAEGLRRRQAQNIGEKRQQQPNIRHRAEPDLPGEAAPEIARTVSPDVAEDSPFLVPENMQRRKEAPKAEAAEPAAAPEAAGQTAAPAAGDSNADAGTEDKPKRERTRRRAQIVTEDGSSFEKPAELELPEWLRVAQQNLTPDSVRRPPAPRVQAAPPQEAEPQSKPLYGYAPKREEQPLRQADVYAAAGYPAELLEEQRRIDAEQELDRLRKRRGAMSVLPEQQHAARTAGNRAYPSFRGTMPQSTAPGPDRQAARMSAVQRYLQPAPEAPVAEPGPYTVTDEEMAARPRFPWLGVLTSLVLLLAVFLWLNRITTAKELEKVYVARQEAAQQVVDEHPYHYRELIEAQAEQYNLHPAFVASIVLNESSFRPSVKSSADAMGLMQIRPDTGTYVNRALEIPGYNHDMLYDPEINIRFGCYYLGELSRRFAGDPILVAAAYNAGPTNVQNWLNNSLYSADNRTIPLDNIPYGDTQTYARRVLRDFAAYKRLYYETPEGEL